MLLAETENKVTSIHLKNKGFFLICPSFERGKTTSGKKFLFLQPGFASGFCSGGGGGRFFILFTKCFQFGLQTPP